MIQEKTPDHQKPTVDVQELIIPNGDNRIYGKLYSPQNASGNPAIILSHGYNGSHADFEAEAVFFATNGYIAYTYDFCGGSNRSKSTGASTDMTIFTEKSDLLAVFDYIAAMPQIDSEHIYLLGGSQGGLVTALAAEERRNNVRGMILYYPALNIPDDWRKKYPSEDDIPETTDFWDLTLSRNYFLKIHDFYPTDVIGNYERDVLILQGDSDDIVPLSFTSKTAQLYKKAKMIVLKGEGHGFSPDGSVIAMEHCYDFLTKLS